MLLDLTRRRLDDYLVCVDVGGGGGAAQEVYPARLEREILPAVGGGEVLLIETDDTGDGATGAAGAAGDADAEAGEMTMGDYLDFVASKVDVRAVEARVEGEIELHPSTKQHQADSIRWALRKGRALIAESFGLGKTTIQCEIARVLVERKGGKFMVVCPLGVKHQFSEEDGPRLGMRWQYVRSDAEIEAADTPYLITNYERVRDGGIDPRKHNLIGVSLDEGSVMRSLGSKTYQVFDEIFADVPFRYVATATPSPNEFRELLYYANWLDVMDNGQGLTRWFNRDPNKAGNLQLHPQHEEEFWMWVASWALFLYTPGDLGYPDDEYQLPELHVHWHRLPVDHTRAFGTTDNRGQHKMFLDATGSVSEASREWRATLEARLAKAQEIIEEGGPDTHWLLWHEYEDERRAIEKAIPEAVVVYGSQDLDERERRLIDFSHGRSRILATKPSIAGSGCNFQRHCWHAVFMSVDYKFKDLIQAVHRIYRFLQDHEVHIHFIYAESQDRIVEAIKRKWAQHDKLQARMREIIRTYKLSTMAIADEMKRKMGVQRRSESGDFFSAVMNDCVLEMERIDDESVGLVHTSIPFGNHYEYTVQYEDFGHNLDDTAFFEQMDYLIPHLYRVLKPGRIAAIHVKDRVLYGHQTAHGFMRIDRFSDKTADAFEKQGFIFASRRTIVTDVVRENNSTYRLGWSEMCKDGTKMGCGLPEYLLTFRKPPTSSAKQYADEPVIKDKETFSRARWQIDAHGFWRSDGRALEWAPYDYEAHVARLEEMDAAGALPATFFVEPPVSYSEGVWDDVTFMRCLNARQQQRRTRNHICPLPLDIVERTIRLYSNEGDVVLDPFAGLFTVPVVAIRLGRYGHGIELAESYWEAGVIYCEEAELQRKQVSLFEWAGVEVETATTEGVDDNGHHQRRGHTAGPSMAGAVKIDGAIGGGR